MELISLLIFLRGYTYIFFKNGDKVALRAEAEKVAYLKISVLRKQEQLCCLLSFCLADIGAEWDTRLRLEYPRKMGGYGFMLSSICLYTPEAILCLE